MEVPQCCTRLGGGTVPYVFAKDGVHVRVIVQSLRGEGEPQRQMKGQV